MKDRVEMIRKNIFWYAVMMILILPSLAITWYSYPCQDDFDYARYGREMLDQGYNLFTMSMAKVIVWYKTFVGAYTSTFMGYFFSGIINCNIWGIRIFEFISAVVFYAALYRFVRVFFHRIMGFDKEKALPCYCLVLSCFWGLIGYSDHDDFFWFITSIQYLLISSFILFGASMLTSAYYEENTGKKKIYMMVSAVLGFLGSGGTLSIAAFCCAIYLLVALWGVLVKRQLTTACIGIGSSFVGAVINGLAPGNYARDGQAISLGRLAHALIQSFRYTFERFEIIVKNPVFWIIMICFMLFLFTCTSQDINFCFPCPILFISFLFCLTTGIMFPTMLGYGYEVYVIMNRGQFISDMALYLFMFLALLYVKGWIGRKYHVDKIMWNKDAVLLFGILIIFLLVTDRYAIGTIPVVKGYTDWIGGKCREYEEFCVGIYEEIEESDEDIVEIHRKPVQDTTYMMNPQFYIGQYDPEGEFANRTIAAYYGKTAVWLYLEE